MGYNDMRRSSISFTAPNDRWVKAQIDSQEFTSKSDVVNDLIRKARGRETEFDAIRAALIEAEQSGFSGQTPEDIKIRVVKRLRKNGRSPHK